MFCLNPQLYAGKAIVFSVLTLDQATKKIIKQNNSKVLSAKTKIFSGKKVHMIKILTPKGRVQSYKVNSETGKISR